MPNETAEVLGAKRAMDKIAMLRVAAREESVGDYLSPSQSLGIIDELLGHVAALENALSYGITCGESNTREWLDGFCESVNAAMERVGSEQRFKYEPRNGSIVEVNRRLRIKELPTGNALKDGEHWAGRHSDGLPELPEKSGRPGAAGGD